MRGWRRYPAAFGVVVASTLTAELLFRVLETTRLSMIFLAGVLITAVWLGSGPAYFAAALAYGIYNFYLVDPRFTLQFATAEDFIVLTVFLIVAMLTGGLAGRVRDEARRSQMRARVTGALFDASREFTSTADESGVQERLVAHLAEAARGDAVIWDGQRLISHPAGITPPRALLATATTEAMAAMWLPIETHEDGGWRARAMRADDSLLGVAAWRQESPEALQPDQSQLIHVLIDLGASAIARARLSATQTEVETLARTEKLRNALLSSISHDLRTPLAAILASVTSLKQFGDRFPPSVRADLSDTIQEEAERLNRFVDNLLQMTRLEAGNLRVECRPFRASDMVLQLLPHFEPRRGARRIETRFAADALVAVGDPILVDLALGNVIENALRYTPDGSLIEVTVSRTDHIVIAVSDEGDGVPAIDLDRIFEKFYRSGPRATVTQGTGLGLSITRGLIEAMGGTVEAHCRDDRTGLRIEIRLPIGELDG